ncbi:MAG TPA: hypothetical protein EYH06_01705 [Chromatiales bacterium]|nr:hypothetical protein [Thiotrichales bacterium]HIP67290.1 hypothetical protein [Chromatiales bacterium]
MVLSLVTAHIGTHSHLSWDHILLHITLALFWVSIMLVGYLMVKKDARKRIVQMVSRALKQKT